jgi:radical SAM protein with 4Fe4S-binding SPASM domain
MHENARFPPPPSLTAAELADYWRANRRRLADDHRRARARAAGRPAHLKLELTNYCNLACPMCPHPQMQREVGYMRPELFRKIIDEAAPELEFAYLHHLGESLFHGHLGELVRYGRSRGAAVGLSTNATFLDERRGRALLDNGLDFLVISLDAASAASYARMRPALRGDAADAFDATVERVRAFLRLRAAVPNHTEVAVQLIVTEHNRHEAREFAAAWRDEGAQVMIKEPRDWAGQLSLVPLGLHARPPIARTPCKLPWTELTVMWDGTVVPCANHVERENVLGDLSRQSLDEVWNGPALRRLRDAHLADAVGSIAVCRACPRHAFDHDDFVATSELAQRHRTYLRAGDLTPRPGLS